MRDNFSKMRDNFAEMRRDVLSEMHLLVVETEKTLLTLAMEKGVGRGAARRSRHFGTGAGRVSHREYP